MKAGGGSSRDSGPVSPLICRDSTSYTSPDHLDRARLGNRSKSADGGDSKGVSRAEKEVRRPEKTCG